jgi:tRNA-dihydrouridine synthase
MVRGSELAFRQFVRREGAVSKFSCYSPMLRAAEVVRAYNKVVREDISGKCKGNCSTHPSYDNLHEDGKLLLTDIMRDTDPLVVQLCGHDPFILSQAVRILCQVTPHLHGVDLNLG